MADGGDVDLLGSGLLPSITDFFWKPRDEPLYAAPDFSHYRWILGRHIVALVRVVIQIVKLWGEKRQINPASRWRGIVGRRVVASEV